jgi:hypothetical protein
LYKKQETKNPWPSVLRKDFLEMIKTLKPNQEIDDVYRDYYRNVIKKHFPTLFDLVKLRRPVKKGATARGARTEMEGIVLWDQSDVDRIQKNFNWQTTPSTAQVRLAQEDLWVYEALLRVIENTNEGSTSYYNASVKRIDALEIGADASRAWSQSENALGKPESSSGNAASSGGGTSSGSTENSGNRLSADRYVNEKGKPLGPDDPPPFAEFKMMPIRMKLVMDQTKINKLLAECANQKMPVEVRRVRITAVESNAVAADAGAGASSSSSTTAGDAETPKVESSGTSDVQVEIHGIIYIYNPPDRNKLGTGAVGERLGINQAGGVGPETAAAPATPGSPTPGAPPSAPGAVPSGPSPTPAPAPAAGPAAKPAVPPSGPR